MMTSTFYGKDFDVVELRKRSAWYFKAESFSYVYLRQHRLWSQNSWPKNVDKNRSAQPEKSLPSGKRSARGWTNGFGLSGGQQQRTMHRQDPGHAA